mgnify:CR=1 FL=1|tara:strand:- start:3150 stop:3386 length:237 start_codon:yes stop_codon:yes gene_type:complete
MKPDIDKYLPMLDGMDLSREQKVQLIHDLWNIMQSFVDRAFGIHPLQQLRNKTLNSNLQESILRLDSEAITQSSEDSP